jgi:hypothetical protein
LIVKSKQAENRLALIPPEWNQTAYPVASWFETRGVAAFLTMRVQDLILRSRALARRLEG